MMGFTVLENSNSSFAENGWIFPLDQLYISEILAPINSCLIDKIIVKRDFETALSPWSKLTRVNPIPLVKMDEITSPLQISFCDFSCIYTTLPLFIRIQPK